MISHGNDLGENVRAEGNRGEGLIFHTCLELLGGKGCALVLGGSPALWADLITAGYAVVYAHNDLDILAWAQEEITKFLSPERAGLFFRTAWRDLECGLEDLVAHASVVVCFGLLHHLEDPGARIRKFLKRPASLVVLDTTTELMVEVIAEEEGRRGYACDEHFRCRDAACARGLSVKEDVDALLAGIEDKPDFFRYGIMCCWCGQNPCGHRGSEYWFATWRKVPLEASA